MTGRAPDIGAYDDAGLPWMEVSLRQGGRKDDDLEIDWWLVASIVNARVVDAGKWHSLAQFAALPALLTRE